MKKICLLIGLALGAGHAKAQSSHSNTTYPNFLRFYALNAFVDGDVGVGLGYERIISKDGKVGLSIPFHIGFRQEPNYNMGTNSTIGNNGFLFNPGLKFYPSGQRKVNYSIGLSLFGLYATNDGFEWDSNLGVSRLMQKEITKAGMLINNAVQFNVGERFNLGMELGLGPAYLNREKVQSPVGVETTYNRGIGFMANFNMHVGIRF
jgi:hypothetical protein